MKLGRLALGLAVCFSAELRAQDVWTGAGPDGLWSTKANWSTPPNAPGHDDILMVGPGHLVNTADTTLFGSAPRAWVLHTISFPDAAPNFIIHVNVVTLDGTTTTGGIFNSSGRLQIFEVDAGNVLANATSGVLTFSFATVQGNVLLENRGGTLATPEPGLTQFQSASAGTATINNFGGYDINFATGGETLFDFASTAATSAITNLGGDSISGSGGSTVFQRGSTAGSSTLHNLAATAQAASGGQTRFTGDNTRGGNATIINDGANVNGAQTGGLTVFEANASADHATITNNSGVTQSGETVFINATGGNALIVNAGSGFFGQAGRTSFDTGSSAGNAVIVNQGGEQFLGHGGTTSFNQNADAGGATLIAQAGAPSANNGFPIPGGLGGTIFFNDNSTGGTAAVQVLGNGALDISGHAATSGVTIGSLEGDGQVNLGARNLSVGSGNTPSEFFYGSLHDGGASGGTGGSFTKVGSGAFALEGSSDYTGATTVSSGNLVIDGNIASSSGVEVKAGATLGGHGFVSTITGAGTVAPGNSPGILTATQVDPSSGMDFTFQMTRAGAPLYGSPAASGNDLLHLTGLAPFTSALNSENQITIDFSGASLADGQIYLGGFFTDAAIDHALVDGATFLYLGLEGFHVQFDGFVTEAFADFQDGTVIDGRVMKFEIEGGSSTTSAVPEPSTYGLLGAVMLAAVAGRRFRSVRRRT